LESKFYPFTILGGERDLERERDRLIEALLDIKTPGETDFSLILCEFDEKSASTEPCLLFKGEGFEAKS